MRGDIRRCGGVAASAVSLARRMPQVTRALENGYQEESYEEADIRVSRSVIVRALAFKRAGADRHDSHHLWGDAGDAS